MNAAANAFALHAPADRAGLRWTASALVIVAIHAGLIAGGIAWYREQPVPGSTVPAIMIDMAPATAAPQSSTQDMAPGPEMQKSDEMSAPPPEPVQQQAVVEEQIPPAPVMEKPEVEAPPEQKPQPTPPPPEPAKIIPDPPKPKPVVVVPPKPKPVRAEVKQKPSETPYAPRSSAAPRAERQAAAASAASAGVAAAAAALATYRERLMSQLQRHKEPVSGRQGVAMLAFTVARSGQVVSSRIAGSSGVAELDAATMALIRRAQPMPPFPPEMTQSSLSVTVPIRYQDR